jgi:pyridoxine kinase
MRPTGPQVVLVTSLQGGRAGADTIDMLLASDAGTFRLQTEKLPRKFSGAGDTLAALFLFHVLAMADPAAAAQRAAASVAGLLRRTWQAGAAELLLVDAQDEFVAPTGVVTCQAA